MKPKRQMITKIGIVILWVFLWQLLACLIGNPLLFASPVKTGETLFELVRTAPFWQSVSESLVRIGAGFLLGFLIACILALAAYKLPFLESFLAPVITLMKAVPAASFVVMLLIWWGSVFLSVAICFLVVLPIIYINVLEGLKNADWQLLEMAEVFNISFRNRFFYIHRPALKPFVASGLKLALGLCFKAGVAAELIGTPDGSIGEQLYLSKIYLDTAGVFAWTIVVILLSVGFEKLILQAAEWMFDREPFCDPTAGDVKWERRSGGNAKRECFFTGDAVNGAETSIRLTDVTKAYGELVVLEHFDAVYEAGKTYELRSPSGSGKTTLLRLLAGLEKPDRGSIQPKIQCAYLFQEDRLCEDYSAVKNVALVTGEEAGARNALRRLLPEEALDKPCRQLSGGMKRRVALVRAMEARADCVLLDEPYTGQDEENRAMMERYIEAEKGNRIVLIASHI